jgi:hypothetical protein
VLARSLGRRRKDILIAETTRMPGGDRADRETGDGRTYGELHGAAHGLREPLREPLRAQVRIVATGMPDVYVAVDGEGRELGPRVSVPTLGVSLELRNAFALTPPGEAVLWTCVPGPGDLLVPLTGGLA